ncbi:MAG: carboxypeptidase-like regulatory domain-containing protein [Planctomycetota bacterium]
MIRHSVACCLMVLASLVISGCGTDGSVYQGVVRFANGEPVQSGSIEFRSLESRQRYSSKISRDGQFTLTDADGWPGLPPDTYEVVIVQIVLTEDLAAEDHQHGQTVPRRFADYYTSGLKVTKTEGQTEPLEIVLPDVVDR